MEAVKDEKQDRGDHAERRLVEVTVDGQAKNVARGKYLVADFKTAVGVAADLVLDQVVEGQFHELSDTDKLHIKGGEQFVSHARGGGSS